MEFHEIFQYIGDIGLYQILLFIAVGLVNFFNGMQSVAPNFFYAPMDHWCDVPRLQNFSFEAQKYIAVPYEDGGGGEYDSCRVFDLDYDSFSDDQLLAWDRNLTIGADTVECTGWVFDRSQFASTISSRFELVCGRSWLAELTSTIYMAGVLVGSITSGAISDRFGRRLPLLVSSFTYFVFALVQAYAPNYPAFVIFRFFTSVSSITCYLCTYVIVLELLGPRLHVLMASMNQIFFSLGVMLVPGISYAIRDDRKFFIALSAPMACFVFFIWLVPESPRWLIVNKRHSEAEKTLRHIAAVNERSFPDDIKWDTGEEVEQPKGKCSDICNSSILCKNLALVYLNWFTVSLVYYGVSFNAGAFGDVFLNTFLSGLIEVPANILCWVCLAYGGRRWANGGSLLVTGAFMLACVPVLLTRPDLESLLTALSTLGKGAITFSFSSVYLYSTELFPTPVRQLALGSASMFARFGSMASPYLGQTLEDVWKPMPSVIFGALAVFTGVMVFFLPETKGKPMPDTIEDAENLSRKKKRPITSSDPIKAFEKSDSPPQTHHGNINVAFIWDEKSSDLVRRNNSPETQESTKF